ncbi:hypothetical protein PVAP13_9KG506100 [Panicum virgatum]|uniref:Pentatricopeptide repeat-containing protein n=1 Tax=Panicum virgatum TaxID=38727 RepID=A0A8T0NMX3_PANVG|nr:hypothetical protein PVAP13_9KG506100 [Panicum virgatum]
MLSALAMPATTLSSSSACFHAPPPLAGERRRLLRIHAPAPASLAACRLRCLAPQTRSLSSFGAPADPAISTRPCPPPPTCRHPPRHRPRASPRDPVPRLPHQAPDFPSPAQALLARGPLHSRRGGIRSNASLGIPSPMPWPGTSSSTSFSGKAISKRIGAMRTRPAPNYLTYAIVLTHRCRAGNSEMLQQGFQQTAASLTAVFACCSKAGTMSELLQLLAFALVSGCKPTKAMWICLIACLCREGRLEEASSVLAKMVDSGTAPCAVTYTPLVRGFLRAGRHDKVSELLKIHGVGKLQSIHCSV